MQSCGCRAPAHAFLCAKGSHSSVQLGMLSEDVTLLLVEPNRISYTPCHAGRHMQGKSSTSHSGVRLLMSTRSMQQCRLAMLTSAYNAASSFATRLTGCSSVCRHVLPAATGSSACKESPPHSCSTLDWLVVVLVLPAIPDFTPRQLPPH